MNTANSEPLRVLRFWRDLEIFNIPAAPSKRDSNEQTKVKTFRRGNPLPWQSSDFAPTDKFGFIHVVYLGVADTEDLSRLLLRGIFPDRDLNERDRQAVAGTGWLAAFVVDEMGRPKPDSYLPASFVHGVAAMRETKSLDNINARLGRAKEEFGQRQAHVPENREQKGGSDNASSRTPAESVMGWEDLDAEMLTLRSLFGEMIDDAGMDWRVVVRTSRVKRRLLDDGLQSATDFLNSFYLDDLDRLITQAEKNHSFGKALSTYLGPSLPEHERIDILADNTAMTGLVGAKHLPSARWPSSPKQPLVLAQQAAVAQITSALGDADGLIGVNGPPGTGKTTLLCDVIAEIVTERARRIAALNTPMDLFEGKVSVAGKNFFPLKKGVMAGTSIVVASSNNNAVKNITQDLPARRKIAGDFASADYFADVMRAIFRTQKVLDEEKQPIDTWGVIAAALGNAGNRRAFAHGFFRDEYLPQRQTVATPTQAGEQSASADQSGKEAEEVSRGDERPPSMKQLLEVAAGQSRQYQDEWRKAKDDFLATQAAFENCRNLLDLAETATRLVDAAQDQMDRLLAEDQSLRQDIHTREQALAQDREAMATKLAVVEGNRAVLAQLRASMPLSLGDRVFGLFGQVRPRMAELRQTLETPTQTLADASAVLAEMSTAVALAETQLKQLRERQQGVASDLAALEGKLAEHRQAIQAGYAMGAKHFPDAGFWSLPADTRHRASVVVSPKLDELRARLFLQAVDLHRLTVLANAGKFIANLRAVNGMLTGGSGDKLSPEHRPLLWDAFFFVVPVVSTTLASFDRLFIGLGQNSLGWLLIDEAGQATPQSAAGAIWRSQRAVIVGDPLQIEPVFTVPRSLSEDLRLHHGLSAHWSPLDESVQTLADRITPFGSWVEKSRSETPGTAPERLWTGMPLRTHRRCDEPMFSVANRIAYAGQMVHGRVDETGRPAPQDFSCSLGESAWYDVRSKRVNHPVSEDEIACLRACLAQLQREKSGKAKIYVISPFRKVAQACRQCVNTDGFHGVECGTVHTFQGKEADIVFLVLGTVPGPDGSGARNWAASIPNLLNVAVTRAQRRLYVIGDASQWGSLDYFSDLLSALPTRNFAVTTGQRASQEKSAALLESSL